MALRIRRFCLALFVCAFGIILLHHTSLFLERRTYPIRYETEVSRYAEMYAVPHSVVYAVMKVESGFDPQAVSHAGACGLMQLTADTFDWIQTKIGEDGDDIFDPETNIRYGVYYLSYLYGRFGDWNTAVIAYNAGPNRVAGWIAEHGTLTVIPFAETREYVLRVSLARQKYEKLYFMQGE